MQRAVVRYLRRAGYAVDGVTTLAEAWERLAVNQYDTLVLDRSVPDGDALDVVRQIRADGATAPVLLLTALGTVGDRVDGLSAGADDYLVKPFAAEELVARVHALMRRRTPWVEPTLTLGDLVVEPGTMSATRAGRDLGLTAKEFAVLRYLVTERGRIVSRSELIEHCWDERVEPLSNVVDVKVAGLRRKLGEPALVHTVRGAGYLASTVVPPSSSGPAASVQGRRHQGRGRRPLR